MDDELRWRPATSDDVPALTELVRAAYRGQVSREGWTSEADLVAGERTDAGRMAAEVSAAGSVVLVAGAQRTLLACCRLSNGSGGVVDLGMFAVDPRRQGGGIGRRMMAIARRAATQRFAAHALELEVVSAQRALIAWYERLGFFATGETRPLKPGMRPLVEGLSFVVMRAPLSPGPWALSWSGGKDSALALHALSAAGAGTPRALITTVTEGRERISVHGVRRELLTAQAAATGSELVEVRIPPAASNAVYEQRFAAALKAAPLRDAEAIAFGDLFLSDIRAYRERQVAATGRRAVFPLWRLDTRALAERFIADGFRAWIVCLDPTRVDPAFAGRAFDESLLAELPAEVDPCGENGEFHTFVADGPPFARPVGCRLGEVVTRDGFVFADLVAS